ncbi:MAG: type IV secretion system DNA-binding domain-containing protein [Candidatus Paceibacterota bacterium]
MAKNWVIEGIDFHPFSDSSAANAAFQLKGNKWTNNSTLRYKFAESKKSSLKIDNFDFGTEYGKKKISWLKKMFMTKAEIYIEPVKLCESVTMIAPMGGGKTVTLTNFVLPPWYNRALINDEKSGDFVSKWYNKRKDIILCPFDSRAHVWDVLSEDIEILEFYIQNTINAVTGGKDNQSFFTNDAKERYQTLARLTLEIESPKEKWNYFIKELEKMFDDVNNGASKSAMDVVGNMQQIVNILKINQFQLACGKKSFTINDFFTKKNQSKIFMLNIDKYTLSLNILFSAFTACFAMIHASQAESKEDLTIIGSLHTEIVIFFVRDAVVLII